MPAQLPTPNVEEGGCFHKSPMLALEQLGWTEIPLKKTSAPSKLEPRARGRSKLALEANRGRPMFARRLQAQGPTSRMRHKLTAPIFRPIFHDCFSKKSRPIAREQFAELDYKRVGVNVNNSKLIAGRETDRLFSAISYQFNMPSTRFPGWLP